MRSCKDSVKNGFEGFRVFRVSVQHLDGFRFD